MSIDWDKVIEAIRDRGWYQGTLVSESGAVCLLGAVALAQEPTIDLVKLCGDVCDYREVKLFHEANRVLEPVIREVCPDLPDSVFNEGDHVWEFNDRPDTTLDDVILVCEKARAEG